jgi:6-phosphogluconolactonase
MSSARPAALIEVHETIDELASAIAGEFLSRLAAAQAAGRVPHVALTGGSIAGRVYGELARISEQDDPAAVDWRRVVFWWGDERFVEPGSPDRNERAAREALLDLVDVDPAHLQPMASTATAPTAEDGATAYGEELRTHGAEAFDIVLLGVGPDAHVASLFPGHPGVEARDVAAVAVHDSPKPPPTRITLTLECLNRAASVWFLVGGEDKADAVARAIGAGIGHDAPAARVSGQDETIRFHDRAAASKL